MNITISTPKDIEVYKYESTLKKHTRIIESNLKSDGYSGYNTCDVQHDVMLTLIKIYKGAGWKVIYSNCSGCINFLGILPLGKELPEHCIRNVNGEKVEA